MSEANGDIAFEPTDNPHVPQWLASANGMPLALLEFEMAGATPVWRLRAGWSLALAAGRLESCFPGEPGSEPPDAVLGWARHELRRWMALAIEARASLLSAALARSNSLLEKELAIFRDSRAAPGGLDADEADLAWLDEAEAAVAANRALLQAPAGGEGSDA